MTDACKLPPPGWWCSRGAGHEGPCAARSDAGTTMTTESRDALVDLKRKIGDVANDYRDGCFMAWDLGGAIDAECGDAIERLIAAERAAVWEAAAAVVDDLAEARSNAVENHRLAHGSSDEWGLGYVIGATEAAAAIRAKGASND